MVGLNHNVGNESANHAQFHIFIPSFLCLCGQETGILQLVGWCSSTRPSTWQLCRLVSPVTEEHCHLCTGTHFHFSGVAWNITSTPSCQLCLFWQQQLFLITTLFLNHFRALRCLAQKKHSCRLSILPGWPACLLGWGGKFCRQVQHLLYYPMLLALSVCVCIHIYTYDFNVLADAVRYFLSYVLLSSQSFRLAVWGPVGIHHDCSQEHYASQEQRWVFYYCFPWNSRTFPWRLWTSFSKPFCLFQVLKFLYYFIHACVMACRWHYIALVLACSIWLLGLQGST